MSDGKDSRLRLVLCWHMHQPDYRHADTGEYRAPWTYLHAIKDYADMAWHLEANPDSKAVVNFTPVLLMQLQDYVQRIERNLADGTDPGDPLLAELAHSRAGNETNRRRLLLAACIRSNRTVIDAWPVYRELIETANFALANKNVDTYLNDQFFSDLLTWYHLVWCGESLRRNDPFIQQLLEKRRHYTLEDHRHLLAWIGGTLKQLIPRYRALAQRGQIELSVSPTTHPILPLLLNFASARESRPQLALPVHAQYPGGTARVDWQLRTARAHFETVFGIPPAGCWPSEGAISDATLQALKSAGFSWTASALGVLVNSTANPRDTEHFHRPYSTPTGPVCFFRDDGLSDRIGFIYKDWQAVDAVADFVAHLETLDTEPATPGRVVSIIMDGENAWDSYPQNAYEFLNKLYTALTYHPRLKLCTFSECLDDPDIPVRNLEKIAAGSWVYGSLDTWIGATAKNAAWDRLVELKQALDQWMNAPHSDEEISQALNQLAVCEASDWFWWLGSGNAIDAVTEFDSGLREQMAALYRFMRLPVPQQLAVSFGPIEATARGGVMLPGYY